MRDKLVSVVSTSDYQMFEKGYQAVSTTIASIIKDIDWRFFSIVLYEESTIQWEESVIIPEDFLISLAERLKKNKMRAVLLIDATREHELSVLNKPEFYKALFKTIGISDLVFTFGGSLTDLKEKYPEFPEVKIGFEKILDYDLFSELLSNSRPIPKPVDKDEFAEVDDIESLSLFLISYLKPPTLTEELMKELQATSKYEIAGQALSSLSVILNPTAAITKGIGYALKLATFVQKRKTSAYQAYIETWRENVHKSFNMEAIKAFIGEDTIGKVKETLHENNLAIIFCDNYSTLQSIFLPFLIRELLKDEENLVFLMDSITRLDRFPKFLNSIINRVEDESIKLASILPTYGFFSEAFNDIFAKLISDRTLYFDVNSKFLDIIFKDRPLSEAGLVMRLFRKVRKSIAKNQVAFVSYDAVSDTPWEFVKPTFTTRVVEGLRWGFRRFVRRFSRKKGEEQIEKQKEETISAEETTVENKKEETEKL